MAEFTLVRARWVLKIIKSLEDGKASGPDGIPVRLFKECASELAPIIAILVRFLLQTRRWPKVWRTHRVHPLFKKGSVSDPGNYRGIHLTNVISKIVERTIGVTLTPFLERVNAFGSDQWAFRKKHSCRDLVALLVSRWLWALDCGFKVGVYLSDISGAFDKVDRTLLTQRLKAAGLSNAMTAFLYDYLAPRSAVVVVQGFESEAYEINNQIFQGTCLGPLLWNVFFAAIDWAIRASLFRPAKFADDLTAFRNFEASEDNESICNEIRKCQKEAHLWGARSRVSFDQKKEHFCILHRMNSLGDVFKLLGVLIDPKLNMRDEIERIRKRASPKIKAILATKPFYATPGLIKQYKSHVLCLLEGSAIAIYHAAESNLDKLDDLQSHFLRDIGVTESEAFLNYNLAPLRLRRDIAALGLLHKIQLGEAHDDFSSLLPRAVHTPVIATKHASKRHGRQFHEVWGSTDYFNRSIFSATRIYNTLPEYIVYSPSVNSFQKALTKDAKFACRTCSPHWERKYNSYYQASLYRSV